MIAQTTIGKWGNSQGVRIPSSIADFLNSAIGDRVTFETKDDVVIIKIEKKELNLYLTESIQNYDFDKDRAEDELLNFDYMPVGNEIIE